VFVKNSLSHSVRHQLELPGRYDQLKAFWEDKKGTLPPTGPGGGTIRSSPFSDILPADLKVCHSVASVYWCFLPISMLKNGF